MSTDGGHTGVGVSGLRSRKQPLLKLPDFGEPSHVPLGTERAVLASMEQTSGRCLRLPWQVLRRAGGYCPLLQTGTGWWWRKSRVAGAPGLLGHGTNQASSQGLGL